MAKVKELGIIISANPYRMRRTEDYIRDYGPEAEKFMQPAKTWLDNGLTVVGQFEGYQGIGIQMLLYITRDVSGKKVLPDQALDRVTVLKLWTTWAPKYLMKEKEIGTLEVGKLADLSVLDKDFFTIPVQEILKIKPQMTVVGGKYRALQGDFAKSLEQVPSDISSRKAIILGIAQEDCKLVDSGAGGRGQTGGQVPDGKFSP